MFNCGPRHPPNFGDRPHTGVTLNNTSGPHRLQLETSETQILDPKRRNMSMRSIGIILTWFSLLLCTLESALGLAVNDPIEANASVRVRNAPPALSDTGSSQSAGARGTIIGGPSPGTAGGYTGNWWQVNWQSGQDGWCAEPYLTKVISTPAPRCGGSTGYSCPGGVWRWEL